MRRLIVVFLVLLPCLIKAQDAEKYLAGAVPVVDGRVIFTREIGYSGQKSETVYKAVYEWLENRLSENSNEMSRIVFTDQPQGTIVGQAEEYLVFKASALSLDRAQVFYRITMLVTEDQIKMEVSHIRYEYNTGNKREAEKYVAENWITDDKALNKAKNKLAFNTGKFRSATIDLVEGLAGSLENSLVRIVTLAPENRLAQPAVVQRPEIAPVTETADLTPGDRGGAGTTGLSGYRHLTPDKIPGNIIKMVGEDWMLITAGTGEQFNMMTASWGGIGVLYNKPVTFCFIHPSRYTYQFMETHDTYTLSFYTEAYREVLQLCGTISGRDSNKIEASGLTPVTTENGGKAFKEAWLIIECRKLVTQPFTPEGICDEAVKASRSGQPLHTMYIGEILNVWVK